MEGGRPLADFDVLAFSISFETDYANVLAILAAAGLPLRSSERAQRRHTPLVIAGGPATFLNPEPLADFVDVFLIGEGEEMVPEFLDALIPVRSRGREELLDGLRSVRGAYIPNDYTPQYDSDGHLTAFDYRHGGPGRVERRFVADLNGFATA